MDYAKAIKRISLLPRSLKDELKSRLGVSQRGAIYALAKRWGIDPDLVIDAGAYHGLWTREMADLFPQARWLLIEPQDQFHPVIAANLKEARIDYQIDSRLVYHSDGEQLDFFVVRDGDCKTGSSIYREKHRETDTLPRRTTTLDSLVRERGIEFRRAFLKMDIQGAELDCLRGAGEVLQRTVLILVETSILDYNQGGPLFHDVDEELNRAGFRLCDVADMLRLPDGRLCQLDTVYLRADHPALGC